MNLRRTTLCGPVTLDRIAGRGWRLYCEAHRFELTGETFSATLLRDLAHPERWCPTCRRRTVFQCADCHAIGAVEAIRATVYGAFRCICGGRFHQVCLTIHEAIRAGREPIA